MKKLREKLSRCLAIVLILGLVLQPGITSLADTVAGTLEGEAVESVKPKASPSNTEEDGNLEYDLATDSDADDGDGELDYDLATDSDAEDTELEPDTVSEDIALFSFMPVVEEIECSAFLNDYDENKLDEVPLELILSRLKDYDGNPVEIPEDKNIVWTYYVDADGEEMEDEAHVVARDGTVDLSSRRHFIRFRLVIFAGSGNQLDMNSTRYNITVYMKRSIDEQLDVKLYRDLGAGNEELADEIYLQSRSPLSTEDVLVIQMNCYDTGHHAGDQYRIEFDSMIARQLQGQIDVDVYQMDDFLAAYGSGAAPSGALTERVMYGGEGEAYRCELKTASDTSADNVLCLVYRDAETGSILKYRAFEIVMTSEVPEINGQFFAYTDGKMEAATTERRFDLGGSLGAIYISLDPGIVDIEPENLLSYGYISAVLYSGYKSDQDYYFAMRDENNRIDRVYLGRYSSQEEADEAGAEDVTAVVLPDANTALPYGYKTPVIDYESEENQDVYYTVIMKDGVVVHIETTLFPNDDDEMTMDDKPVVNMMDPYFCISGARGYNDALVVENNYNYTMDTYYGYGYQTIFLLDTDVDLSHVVPFFYSPEEVIIHSGEKQESGKSEKDFSDGPVSYQAHFGNKKRNYQVTFAKKQSGPSLFVNGPDKREVFLTKYFDYHHDILIANLGDSELTGLNVELKDAQHVKLDDYWVVGGQGNDTLGAFTDTRVDWEYVELANIAKVRLVPDGAGELSGTLVISADGQEPVEIELQGYASNPMITSDGLGDAVKYVPYSYMIATNNMYYEVQETYKITEGTLPKGLELNSGTGEIYGVPLEAGDFDIQVEVTYQNSMFEPSYQDLTLTVNENTNANVYNASDEGYEIEEHIGTETAEGNGDYLLKEPSDQLYVSVGLIEEFVDLWLNGEKLVEGTDYTKVSGSTRMTIRSQTFEKKGVKGTNTIAAEFRAGGGEVKTLRRTSQNFRMENKKPSGNENNNNSNSNTNTGSSTTSSTSSTSMDGYSDNSWSKDEQGWRCKNPDGTWLTSTWKKLPYQGTVNWYYFKEDGYMATGWLTLNGRTYYLNTGADGVFGSMSTSWKYIDNAWYYFDAAVGENEGAMLHGGWAYLPYQDTTEWYYFDATGKMATGWLSDEGKYYYLHPVPDGTRGHMLTGWQLIDGKWYYFYEPVEAQHGAMAANTQIGEYRVGSNGARVE